jgi:hypothetical protein
LFLTRDILLCAMNVFYDDESLKHHLRFGDFGDSFFEEEEEVDEPDEGDFECGIGPSISGIPLFCTVCRPLYTPIFHGYIRHPWLLFASIT